MNMIKVYMSKTKTKIAGYQMKSMKSDLHDQLQLLRCLQYY